MEVSWVQWLCLKWLYNKDTRIWNVTGFMFSILLVILTLNVLFYFILLIRSVAPPSLPSVFYYLWLICKKKKVKGENIQRMLCRHCMVLFLILTAGMWSASQVRWYPILCNQERGLSLYKEGSLQSFLWWKQTQKLKYKTGRESWDCKAVSSWMLGMYYSLPQRKDCFLCDERLQKKKKRKITLCIYVSHCGTKYMLSTIGFLPQFKSMTFGLYPP